MTKPKPKPEWKRLNIIVKRQLHDQFKAATAARGTNMTDELLDFMRRYVRKNQRKTADRLQEEVPNEKPSSRPRVLPSHPSPPAGSEPDPASGRR